MELTLRNRAEELTDELRQQGSDYLDWLFLERFFPSGLLPASFNTENFTVGSTKVLSGSDAWRMPLKISPPDDRLTSSYFGLYHPDALHDFFVELKHLDLMSHLSQSERITSYALPMPVRQDDSERIRGTSDYLRFEEDISSDAWSFAALIKLDVKQCYPSIYSHAIHWAIDGYENVRQDNTPDLKVVFSKSGIGHQLDTSVHAMNGGITKGIMVGPGASDLIAELLFRRIDKEISDAFEEHGFRAYGARFKDDYRIFVSDDSQIASIIEIIETILRRYLLHLNDDKTITGHPFEILQREWMVKYNYAMTGKANNQKQFLWYLAHITTLQREYPGKRLLAKFLSNTEYLPDTKDELIQIVSVLLSLADSFRSAVPYVVSYIEKAAERFDGVEISKYLQEKLALERNVYNAIWYLHFIATHVDDYQAKLDGKFEESFNENPFWKSLYYQSDHLFPNRIVGGNFFKSLDSKIYEQTQIFAEAY